MKDMEMLIAVMLLLCMCSNVIAAEGDADKESKHGSVMNYTEETLTFMVDGKPQEALMRTPSRLCDEPALLIMLGANKEELFYPGGDMDVKTLMKIKDQSERQAQILQHLLI